MDSVKLVKLILYKQQHLQTPSLHHAYIFATTDDEGKIWCIYGKIIKNLSFRFPSMKQRTPPVSPSRLWHTAEPWGRLQIV